MSAIGQISGLLRFCARRSSVLGVLSLLAVAIGATGCGDDSGGETKRLSSAAYTARLAALNEREGRVHAEVEKALKADSVSEIRSLIAAFGVAEQRLGDDVAKIDPPADAEAANARLADGAHQYADDIRATVDALSQAKTPKAALALLNQRLGDSAGVKMLDAALTELKKLGYSKSG